MIKISHLSKSYGAITALNDINLFFQTGEIVFLVGPNGAGKSTLMKLITGYITPSKGDIYVNDMPVQENRKFLTNIGYVPENAPLYGDMTTYEYIHYSAQLHKVSKQEFEKTLPFVLQNLQLHDVLNQKTDTLSKGYRRRVAIAGALIHNPKILILDEPTEGLDPNQKHQLHSFLKEYGKNRLIIISTHLMEEVEAIADRVIIINKGNLIWDDKPAELKDLSPDGSVDTAFRLLTKGEN